MTRIQISKYEAALCGSVGIKVYSYEGEDGFGCRFEVEETRHTRAVLGRIRMPNELQIQLCPSSFAGSGVSLANAVHRLTRQEEA
jgi:hypothetical protein